MACKRHSPTGYISTQNEEHCIERAEGNFFADFCSHAKADRMMCHVSNVHLLPNHSYSHFCSTPCDPKRPVTKGSESGTPPSYTSEGFPNAKSHPVADRPQMTSRRKIRPEYAVGSSLKTSSMSK